MAWAGHSSTATRCSSACSAQRRRRSANPALAAGMGRAGPLAQVDQLVGGLLDAEPLGQGGGQQQAGVGDGVGVVEADVELVGVIIMRVS
jgi:hypothetical protein